MLQKARIKIVAHAIYTHLFFFLIHTLSSSAAVVITVFLSKLDHRPLFNYIYCETVLERIGFNMINKRHHFCPLHHVSLNLLSFGHYCFTQNMKYAVMCVITKYVVITFLTSKFLKWVFSKWIISNWVNLHLQMNHPISFLNFQQTSRLQICIQNLVIASKDGVFNKNT